MRTRLSLLACAAMLGAAVAFPLGVIASHNFSDVPPGSFYHGDIGAIADAGITTGCGGGRFCPKDYVTREQMAAFLNRLGALQAGKTPVVNATKVDGLDSSQFVRSDVARTGRETCAGTMMMPTYSTLPSSSIGARRSVAHADGGTVRCGLRLPDGATITAFSGRLSDTAQFEQVTCYLDRYEKSDMLVRTSIGSFGSTDAYTGGVFFRNDTTISQPVVDNELYAYLVSCTVSSGSDLLQILHVDVVYTVTGVGLP